MSTSLESLTLSFISTVIMLPRPKDIFSASLTFHYRVFIYPPDPLPISLNTPMDHLFFHTYVLHVQNCNLSKLSFSEPNFALCNMHKSRMKSWVLQSIDYSPISNPCLYYTMGLAFSIFRPVQKANMIKFTLGVKEDVRASEVKKYWT